MPTLSVSFTGRPGDDKDKLCHTIFRAHNGKFEGAGTWIDGHNCERDMQYSVSKAKLVACKAEMLKSGFKVHGE